ncbi:MAG: hypothetical protein JSU05_00425 [Bacteroidetes bacterium]|nr:hypothetical protein [Bacteroidota bacterium]
MKLYDRLYYTFYRLLLKLDDMFSMQRETPRAETALILSILTGFNVITVLALLTEFMGVPVFSAKKIYIMLMLSPVVFINLLLIFYKKRYKKVEEKLLPMWKETKSKNILIAIGYIVFTVVFFCLTIQYIKSNPMR